MWDSKTIICFRILFFLMIWGHFAPFFCYELSTDIVFTYVNLFWIWYSIVDNFCPKKLSFRWELSFYFDVTFIRMKRKSIESAE